MLMMKNKVISEGRAGWGRLSAGCDNRPGRAFFNRLKNNGKAGCVAGGVWVLYIDL